MLVGLVKSLEELKVKLSSTHPTCECQMNLFGQGCRAFYETIATLWVESGEG